eukprot:11046078-Alexandrium_andersonii.AAC.1
MLAPAPGACGPTVRLAQPPPRRCLLRGHPKSSAPAPHPAVKWSVAPEPEAVRASGKTAQEPART